MFARRQRRTWKPNRSFPCLFGSRDRSDPDLDSDRSLTSVPSFFSFTCSSVRRLRRFDPWFDSLGLLVLTNGGDAATTGTSMSPCAVAPSALCLRLYCFAILPVSFLILNSRISIDRTGKGIVAYSHCRRSRSNHCAQRTE